MSKSNEEPVYRPRLGMGCCGSKMGRRTLSGRIVSLHDLVSIPNRITSSGKSKSSCVFTQQGRKGVNQDSMIVWEVSLFFFLNDVYRSVSVSISKQDLACVFCRILCRKI